jgi:ribonuclease P protein component
MKRSFRLLPSHHLRRPQDFQQIYDRGQRAGDAHLLAFALPNALPYCRLGLSVSKKHGTAVWRNLKRRRLKEAYRILQHDLPVGLDLVLVPRQRDDSTLQDYCKSLLALTGRLARKLRGPRTSAEERIPDHGTTDSPSESQ